MLTRSKSKKGEGFLVEEDPEIGSKVWKKQMAEKQDSKRNVYAELDVLKSMVVKMTMAIEDLRNEARNRESSRESLGRNNTQEGDDDHISFFKSKKSPLKLEVKFDLPTYDGEVNAEKLDFWIKQIEVYYRVHEILDERTKIQLATLKLGGLALIWWESRSNLDVEITTWRDFTKHIKDQYYPLGYIPKIIMEQQNLRQGKGQSVQDYTTEFRKKANMLGIALNSDETLFKYIGGLHSYLRHKLLLFYANDLDKVCVQATHLEARDKLRDQDPKGKKQVNVITKKEDKKDKGHCTHCDVDGHTDATSKLHPDKAPKWFGKNQEKKNALVSKGKEPYCVDVALDIDEQMNCMGVKNSYELSEEN